MLNAVPRLTGEGDGGIVGAGLKAACRCADRHLGLSRRHNLPTGLIELEPWGRVHGCAPVDSAIAGRAECDMA